MMVISHPTSSSARKSKPDELEKKVVTFHELALPIFIRNWFTMTRNVILARWVKKRIVKYSEHKIVRKLFWRYHLLYNYRVGQKKTSKIEIFRVVKVFKILQRNCQRFFHTISAFCDPNMKGKWCSVHILYQFSWGMIKTESTIVEKTWI